MAGRVAKAIGPLGTLHATCLFDRQAAPDRGLVVSLQGTNGEHSQLQGRGLNYESHAPGQEASYPGIVTS